MLVVFARIAGHCISVTEWGRLLALLVLTGFEGVR